MTNDCYANISNNKDNKKKYIKTFDLSQIAEDPMDLYLESIGLWKKRIARDGSCLFRSVAEQIYPCQNYHTKVREECVEYMSRNRQDYEKYVNNIQFDQYLNSMRDHLEYGGQLEIHAMSKLYRRDFIIYQQPNTQGINVTQNDAKDKILLCYSFNNHFDAVFTKDYRDHLALMQSLVYEILYDKVYGSAEQVDVARCLLRKSDTIYPKEFMNSKDGDSVLDELEDYNDTDENNNIDNEFEEMSKIKDNNTDDSLMRNDKYNGQKMPLPYKVAKSLDPVIYRNTAFDAWLATKKDDLNQKMISMMPGDKCLMRLNNEYRGNWMIGLVQSINNNTATIHLPELRQSHCVTLDNVKPFNTDIMTNTNHVHNVQKHVQPFNSQFAIIFSNSNNRKPKKKPLQIKKSSSCHVISTGLETLPEENEEEEFMHHYYPHNIYLNEFSTPLVHSQSMYTGFNTDKFGINSSNKLMYQNNKNRRLKYNGQSKPWNNQSYSSNNLVGTFQNAQMSNDPLGAPMFAPPPPLYNTSSAMPSASISQQGYQNAHYQPYMMTQACDPFYYANLPTSAGMMDNKSIDSQQYELKRHGSYDSCLNKVQPTQGNMNSYQQVPQHPIATSVPAPPPVGHLSSNQSDLNSATNNYLLMPAPSVAPTSLAPTHTTSGMQRSYSCHAGIASSSFEASQPNSSGPVYLDYYLSHHQNSGSIYTSSATGTPLMLPQNQTVLINNSNGTNATTAPTFSHNCLDSHSGYDFQFPRLDSNSNLVSLSNGIMEDSLNLNETSRLSNQSVVWNKDKTGKNESVFSESMYANSGSNLNAQQYCYPYVIINIDGPINYNASYSHADDGSDLNLADINTLRFFFNLGIEHYRLCSVNNGPYNQSNFSSNYIPTTQPLIHQTQHMSIADQNNNNNNNNNGNAKINNGISNQDIDKMNSKNQSMLVDNNIVSNNNNITTNQLVPNSKTFMSQQSRRITQ